jgi:hypothetical protein
VRVADLDVPGSTDNCASAVRDEQIDVRAGRDQVEERSPVRRRLREDADDLQRSPSFQPIFRTVSRVRRIEPRLRWIERSARIL